MYRAQSASASAEGSSVQRRRTPGTKVPGLLLFGTIAVAAACSADGGGDARDVVSPSPDSGPSEPPFTADEAGARDAGDAGVDAPVDFQCSDAGWCTTVVPDPSIHFFALAPFENKAFALAWLDQRTTPLVFDGVRWNVLADDHWVLTPKGKQSLYALATPNEHEVWVGGANGLVVRGVDTSGSWSWTAEDLGTTETIRSIYVASSDEAYALTDLRVFRKKGQNPWTVDYEAPAVEAEYPETYEGLPATLRNVVGSGPEDVWLLGTRRGASIDCLHMAHRTGAGWVLYIDAISANSPDYSDMYCTERPGYPTVYGLDPKSTSAPAPRSIVMLDERFSTLLRARLGADGLLEYTQGSAPQGMRAIWQVPNGDALYVAGFGAVMTYSSDSWQFSTVSLDGKSPLPGWLEAVGGVSEKNVWVAGESYALHRILP